MSGAAADDGKPPVLVGILIGSALPMARVRRQVASAGELGFDSFWW
jgi:hypothetical protein